MMRAGKLDRMITIEKSEERSDKYGGIEFVWTKYANLRAQIVQASTEEFIRAYGASDEAVIIFRTRYMQGVENKDRIIYSGEQFNIKEIKEIGRRDGLEIRCVRLA